MNDYYLIMTGVTVAILGMMICIVAGATYLSKDTKKGYILAFVLIAGTTIAEFLGVYLDTRDNKFIKLHYLVKFIEFSIAPFILVVCSKEIFDIPKDEEKIMNWICMGHIIIELISMPKGWIFYIDSNNIYHHGRFYDMYIVICVIAISYVLKATYRFSKAYQNQSIYILILILVFVVTGIITQTITGIRIDWLMISIATVFLYIYHNGIIQYTDGLTQLRNQRSFLNDTSGLKKNAIVVLFDVDDFKKVNDIGGHLYGDHCLVEVAQCIKNVYEARGLCYRTGGDEFAVVLEHNLKEVEILNEQFNQKIKEMRDNDKNFPTVSLGYAIFNPAHSRIEDIIREADTNMYSIKSRKKAKN